MLVEEGSAGRSGVASRDQLDDHFVTAVVLFVFLLGVHGGLMVLSFPSEFKASGIRRRYLALYGIPAAIAFGFACYACLASWGWTGIPQLQPQ